MKDVYYEQIEVSIFLKQRRDRRSSAPTCRPARRATRWSRRSRLRDQGRGVRAVQGACSGTRPTWSNAVKPDAAARVVPGQAERPGAVRADLRQVQGHGRAIDEIVDQQRAAREDLQHPRLGPEHGAGRRHRAWRRRPAAGRQHHPGGRVQQAPRGRGHEAGRRVQLVHPGAVRAGGGGRRPDRRDPRLRRAGRWRRSSCFDGSLQALTDLLTPVDVGQRAADAARSWPASVAWSARSPPGSPCASTCGSSTGTGPLGAARRRSARATRRAIVSGTGVRVRRSRCPPSAGPGRRAARAGGAATRGSMARSEQDEEVDRCHGRRGARSSPPTARRGTTTPSSTRTRRAWR